MNSNIGFDIDKLHTTELGKIRIANNLKISSDVVTYCKNLIQNTKMTIYKKGKNWYCENNKLIITINSYNYTIITAHKKENKWNKEE